MTTNGILHSTRHSNGISNGVTNSVEMTGARAEDIFVLICTSPISGHLTPLLQIAESLVQKRYDVTFLSAGGYKHHVTRTGATYFPLIGPVNLTVEENITHLYPEYVAMTGNSEQLRFYSRYNTRQMPTGTESIRRALEHLHDRDSHRQVVILCESWFGSILPLKLGADLPRGYTKLPKTLGISIVPAVWTSIDVGPFNFGLPPDPSPAGRQRNALLARFWAERNEDLFEEAETMLRFICGTKKPMKSLFGTHADLIDHGLEDAWFVCHDTILQMCVPSLELPRSDWPANFKFGGSLPKKSIPPKYEYPPWWPEILENNKKPEGERKKVIMLAQGTIIQDYNEIIIPSIRALAYRDDLIVMAILGAKGAMLAPEVTKSLPPNVRVTDYLLYDLAMEQSDVFVATGGYGSLQHAASNGLPMILGGVTEDKKEVALRAELAGFAINLRVKSPSSDMVAEAVDKVLKDAKYKQRALEIKNEVEDFKALDVVEREMLALLRKDSPSA